jgi:uncharacterized protein with HEPN domain
MIQGTDAGDEAYLGHMLTAVTRIRRYAGRKGRAAFFKDSFLQDAIIRNVEVIGEAAGRLSPEFTARHPAIPWRKIIGMRHRLIHGYVEINLETVWDVVVHDARTLEKQLQAVLTKPPEAGRKGRRKNRE